MKLSLGLSPCPNDTFIFDALVNGAIDTGGLRFDPVLEDVETLNEWALEGRLDVTKLSYGVLPLVSREYVLLESGGALGRGVGPLLVTSAGHGTFDPAADRVALPGEHTTAHLLFSFAYPGARRKEFRIFSDIEAAVRSGEVEAGVLIHEGRFTYAAKGLVKQLDLGEHWESRTGSPIPLGGIVARRSLGAPLAREIERLVRASVDHARRGYPRLGDFVRRHAQEMDEQVMRQHVDLYVNDFSVALGAAGRRSVRAFLEVFAQVNPDAAPAAVDPFLDP